LAQRAVDAAKRAGAQYADARLTRMEHHRYGFSENSMTVVEHVGIGVRALVDGYWGFAACPSVTMDRVERLAGESVAQAVVNAKGATPRVVELGTIPPAVGHWATPVKIDPFAVPIEEKHAFQWEWQAVARKVGLVIDSLPSHLQFTREERVVATSEGGRFTQTVYESGGVILIQAVRLPNVDSRVRIPVQGIGAAGRGWELFLDADIPGQIRGMVPRFSQLSMLMASAKPAQVGRYTLVCDGATMAAMLNATLGVATQLDRALGYEANASGTSFITDPLAMVGTFQLGSSLVNVTANRSAPAQLATVQWDAEGVTPPDFQVVKNGVLTDFQTTREQAAWLAPYYTKVGRPVRSNGCAAAESALAITMQHMPNLSLEPGASMASQDDLIANVQRGLLVEQGALFSVDAQSRNGLLISPSMRHITNGRLGTLVTSGAIQFNTIDFWKNVIAVGGPATRAVVPFTQYPGGGQIGRLMHEPVKGQPAQLTSHSVQAVAATITNQAVINPDRKA
jgi:TldD protein